jgi:hypothetical protein
MARHYSRGSARPASVTPEMLTRDFTAAAAVARARLLNVARSLGLTMHFEVSRTGSALIDPDRLEPGDLLAVIEPADPLARSSHPFAALRARIAAANGPVLYVPHGAASRKGPVLSIAGDADRNDLELVEQMVRAFGDDIVLASEADLPRLKAETARERMIILRRGARILSDSAAFSALVTARRVPALIVGHPAGRSAEEESGPREAGNV